jgi:group I intron endonuclease
VYKTTNLINGKIYVGQDLHNNPNYLGSGIALNNAIKKYGKENFKKETLEECDNKEILNLREVYWIDKLNAINTGYNIAKGGTGGDTLTKHPEKDVIYKKRSQAIRDAYNRMSVEEKKKKFSSEEKRIHCAEIQRERMKDLELRKKSGRSGSEHWAYGKKQSKETIEKRLLNTAYTRRSSGPFAPRQLKVVDVLTGNVSYYDSISDTVEKLNLSRNLINYLIHKNKNADVFTVKNNLIITYYNDVDKSIS